ncbi:MAG: aminopeptidase P family protein, partial [Halomonadaceae bacterium]|nr:aminopeptidase P family protein [Halomonadaceae bacterium]
MDHLQYRHALAAQLEASELAFPVSEYDARLARVRGAMREAG